MKRQLDFGRYRVLVRDQLVGEVIVAIDSEQPDNPKRAIEHWFLGSDFTSPSRSNADVEIRFEFVEDTSGRTVDELLTEARENLRSTDTYIIAKCATQEH